MTEQKIEDLAFAAAAAARDVAYRILAEAFGGPSTPFPSGKADSFDLQVRRLVEGEAAALIRAKLAHDSLR